ncbi:tetratricopeptide repeat protein [Yoonia sediminilitoris]|uniref:Sel1 repeat-containing protein n=1 Tax=Yoonia sediminilitoris TaxID=1286148 RepID=A0A2T6KHC3_9RHOB|nr:tetratricopeptide repeat protein [Yoonia sediminilitoris]PUB14914.1 Sel1 repeat-containing protein [Yoonia sediminilitoris]RCW95631.1 Sel1 repeat-containing protein [Yoonia sediminilitoris]
MRHFTLPLAALVALCPLLTRAQGTGADAFENRDFITAQERWLEEAREGSAEAMLGLGLLADRGYGQGRDQDMALDWYLQAATLGLAEAQFNVAIMYDAGLGRPRDAQQAQLWYTRAALRGHTRAQYNLGLLFETGDGIPQNLRQAAYWFAEATPELPAAAEKTISIELAPDLLTAPAITFAEVGSTGIELIWNTSAPEVLVEVANLPELGETDTDDEYVAVANGSGLLTVDMFQSDGAVWRVSSIAADGSDYMSTDWQSSAGEVPQAGRITFVVDPDISGMEAAANIFASQLRDDGFRVHVERDARPEAENYYISYGFASDLETASKIASYLPAAGPVVPIKQVVGGTLPGEIVVHFNAYR